MPTNDGLVMQRLGCTLSLFALSIYLPFAKCAKKNKLLAQQGKQGIRMHSCTHVKKIRSMHGKHEEVNPINAPHT